LLSPCRRLTPATRPAYLDARSGTVRLPASLARIATV